LTDSGNSASVGGERPIEEHRNDDGFSTSQARFNLLTHPVVGVLDSPGAGGRFEPVRSDQVADQERRRLPPAPGGCDVALPLTGTPTTVLPPHAAKNPVATRTTTAAAIDLLADRREFRAMDRPPSRRF
jgi:hypothetical protein